MKKCLFGFLCLLGLSHPLRAQTVTINIDAGYLETAGGAAGEPVGGLLQLIASPSGTFGAPTSSSYVSGDDVVVESFAMNYRKNTPETANGFSNIPLTSSNYTITSGEQLILRFYPSLTYASEPSTPGTAAGNYGQVRSGTKEFTFDSSETPWVVPASGVTADLYYITQSDGGTYADNTAFAVPEPSTYAVLGCGTVCLLSLRRRVRA